ncbi:MAG: TIGR02391 family protein [Pseudomonadota bacterium]
MSDRLVEEIEYRGRSGATQTCLTALAELLQRHWEISHTALVTCGQNHGFVVIVQESWPIVIRSGFSSGYNGEGPRGLATALSLLGERNTEVEEYCVPKSFMQRLNNAQLLAKDIERLIAQKPVRPTRIYDYIWSGTDGKRLGFYDAYPLTLPCAVLDPRLDKVLPQYLVDPDATLLKAYVQLESRIRERSQAGKEPGVRLMRKAFNPDNALLKWHGRDREEAQSLMHIFSGVYGAFRNRRAHEPVTSTPDLALRELLLLNELYRLESEAVGALESSGQSACDEQAGGE